MAKIVQDGDGKRGLLGRLCLIIFLLFNASMLGWLLSFWGTFGDGFTGASDVERAGATIDATVTTSVILVIWLLGAGITGLLALFTRRPLN